MILFPNCNVTIYNKFYDPINEVDAYQRTVIKDSDWQNKSIATVTDKGLLLANQALIFLDYQQTYISPKKFLKLPADERKKYFTLASGDKIVKGEIDFEITGRKPNSIADLEKNYDDVVTILSVEIFEDFIEIGGK